MLFGLSLLVGQTFVLRTFLLKVRDFEDDVDSYENAPVRLVTEEEELQGGKENTT